MTNFLAILDLDNPSFHKGSDSIKETMINQNLAKIENQIVMLLSNTIDLDTKLEDRTLKIQKIEINKRLENGSSLYYIWLRHLSRMVAEKFLSDNESREAYKELVKNKSVKEDGRIIYEEKSIADLIKEFELLRGNKAYSDVSESNIIQLYFDKFSDLMLQAGKTEEEIARFRKYVFDRLEAEIDINSHPELQRHKNVTLKHNLPQTKEELTQPKVDLIQEKAELAKPKVNQVQAKEEPAKPKVNQVQKQEEPAKQKLDFVRTKEAFGRFLGEAVKTKSKVLESETQEEKTKSKIQQQSTKKPLLNVQEEILSTPSFMKMDEKLKHKVVLNGKEYTFRESDFPREIRDNTNRLNFELLYNAIQVYQEEINGTQLAVRPKKILDRLSFRFKRFLESFYKTEYKMNLDGREYVFDTNELFKYRSKNEQLDDMANLAYGKFRNVITYPNDIYKTAEDFKNLLAGQIVYIDSDKGNDGFILVFDHDLEEKELQDATSRRIGYTRVAYEVFQKKATKKEQFKNIDNPNSQKTK